MQSMVIRVPELPAADHDPTDVLQEPQRNGGRLPQRARGRTDGVWAARDADSGRRGVLFVQQTLAASAEVRRVPRAGREVAMRRRAASSDGQSISWAVLARRSLGR